MVRCIHVRPLHAVYKSTIEHRFGPKFIVGPRLIEYFPSLSKPKRPVA
jgi:hypothetical protein